MKTIFPWSAVIVLLASSFLLLTQNKRAQAELADLRQQSEQLKKVDVEKEELKRVGGQLDELVRLRKENEELHRLRNEVRQLREQKQQVAGTGQPGPRRTAQSPVGTADQQQVQLQQLLAENERLRAENLAFQQRKTVESQVNACINNLRILDGAKEQWALENKKVSGTFVNAVEIQPYLKGNVIPACPAGGIYVLNPVGTPPVCSIPGHALPQQ